MELGSETVLPTTEGLVTFPRFTKLPAHWQLSDGTTVVEDWLSVNSVKSVLSDAGRSTDQIIKVLGGFGLGSIANPVIIEMLNKLSRKPVSPSAHYLKLKNQIRDATKQDIWGGGTFATLVQKNVLELGLELKCRKCSSWNWYSLKQLAHEMLCALCIQQFPFPVLDPGSPDHARWAYRLIGPFVLPDYAAGGYAASLAIRFFSDVLGQHDHADVTWSAGRNLELGPNEHVEADFILWYRRKTTFGNDYPTDLLFGEAKSFGKDAFRPEDIDRMKRLAERFPGSVIIFATMKPATELSNGEIRRLSQFALWGRESKRDKRQTRAPLIVLTGTELFSRSSLREAWERVGGRHAALCQAAWLRFENLPVLADLTQQLYLGLPSYNSWLDAKWNRIRARRAARAGPAQPQAEN